MKQVIFLALIACSAISCRKAADQAHGRIFSKIIILGNSITTAPGAVGTEWTGPWGMAASKAELDYVHLLTAEFTAKNPASTITIKNIAAFERNFSDYDFDTNLKNLQAIKADLLILRIGENLQLTDASKTTFQKRYQELIAYFKSNNPNLRILGVGSVWGNEIGDNIMSRESDFITLKSLLANPSNFAWGLYVDPGVQSHPSDKGMKAIAAMIWTKVETLR